MENQTSQNPIEPKHNISLGKMIIIAFVALFTGALVFYFANLDHIKDPGPIVKHREDEFKDWKTYVNQEYGYQIKYPDGWEIIDITKKEDDSFSFRVVDKNQIESPIVFTVKNSGSVKYKMWNVLGQESETNKQILATFKFISPVFAWIYNNETHGFQIAFLEPEDEWEITSPSFDATNFVNENKKISFQIAIKNSADALDPVQTYTIAGNTWNVLFLNSIYAASIKRADRLINVYGSEEVVKTVLSNFKFTK